MRLTVAGPYTAYLMSLAPRGTLPRQDVRGETMRPLDEMIALQVETDNNGEGWTDSTTPRTAEPARFFYHWESKVGVSHVGNVVAPWGRNTYRR